MLQSMLVYLTAVLVLIASTVASAAYTNHTVGGPAGWFFNRTTNSPVTKYSAWAAAPQTFNLGDYLIFNTNTNQTVVQTYNATTYANCTADYSSDNDTLIFDSGAGSFSHPMVIAVPLVKVGPNYFFSDAGDGAQCLQGMRFEIKVNEGSGLPPSLNQPPPPPYSPPPATETPPVFQSSSGGQGERIHNGGDKMTVEFVTVVLILAGFLWLGLVV